MKEYWIVDPLTRKILVYRLEKKSCKVEVYGFEDTIPVGIYEAFSIDFTKLDLEL